MMSQLYPLLLAMALITSPDEPSKEDVDALKPWLQAAAVALDLATLDERTAYYNEDGEIPMCTVYRQGYAACKSYPPSSDVERLPIKSYLEKSIAINKIYADDIALRLSLDPRCEEALLAQDEAEQLLRWHEMALAARTNEYYTVLTVRENLHSLRVMMGDNAYYSGYVPPPVPLWRLQWAK